MLTSVTNIRMLSRGKLNNFIILWIMFKCTNHASTHTHIFICKSLPKYLCVFPNLKRR